MFEQTLSKNINIENANHLSVYRAGGGYEALDKALQEFEPEQLIDLVKQSNLRGRGGAGFATGLKWSFIPKDSLLPKFLCCNADESEPGTFKDRLIIEKDPHQLIEGIALCCYAVGAKIAYVYIRAEYSVGTQILQQALDECYQQGLLGKNILGSKFDLDVYIHRGAGAYICGEETALLQSLEGFRGQPRLKPPFPAISGLYASPTVINNVETLACIPHIVTRGAQWFKDIGSPKGPGPRLYCLSGRICNPGVYELPTGISLRELVEQHGGGAPNGKRIKAVIPGGISAPMLPESALDIAMDFDDLMAAGSMLGSAGVIVMDEDCCIVKVTQRMLLFFHYESCGKCAPCREGLSWVVKLLQRIEAGCGKSGDIEELERLSGGIFGNCLCPLGDGAIMALRGAITHFRDEFIDHIDKGCCPNGTSLSSTSFLPSQA
jgi:NADH-quinone oxidoreductase subunit F